MPERRFSWAPDLAVAHRRAAQPYDPRSRQTFYSTIRLSGVIAVECEAVDCEMWREGWLTIVPADGPQSLHVRESVRKTREYVETVERGLLSATGKVRFTHRGEMRETNWARFIADGIVTPGPVAVAVFAFPPGQPCLQHRIAIEPPKLLHFDGRGGLGPLTFDDIRLGIRHRETWEPADWLEKMHEETDRVAELRHREGV